MTEKEAEEQARFYANETNTTMKFDGGKAPLDLVPMSAVFGLAEVLGYGAKKYTAWNWRKGLIWSRYYAAAMRHLFQWWCIGSVDPESGISHLKHAMCNIAFLIEYEQSKLGEDDRPK